eukprot:Sspe_Gene.54194::Locus_29922_Transcript_1_1_Confidence_1.000_Length_1191::g.54194::m.54194
MRGREGGGAVGPRGGGSGTHGGELVGDLVAVRLAGAEDNGGEVRVVHAVGVVVGLEAHRVLVRVGELAVGGKEVPRVHLHCWFGGSNSHHTAALAVGEHCNVRGVQLLVPHKVVVKAHVSVVATPVLDKLHTVAEEGRCAEVEWRACDILQFTKRDLQLIGRGVSVAHELERVRGDGLLEVTAKVPVAVVGEVDRCGLVCRRSVHHPQRVVGEAVLTHHLELSWVSLVAIFTHQGHPHPNVPCALDGLRIPDLLVEPLVPAVEVCGTPLVLRQLVLLPIEGPPPVACPVRDTSASRTVEGVLRYTGCDVVERLPAQCHLFAHPVAVRDLQGCDGTAVRNELATQPVPRVERELLHGFA